MAVLLLAGPTFISCWFAFAAQSASWFSFVLKTQFYAQEEAGWKRIIISPLEIYDLAELLTRFWSAEANVSAGICFSKSKMEL